MKTYLLGDIHGEIERLKECLQLVNFDYEKDTLIQLGDVVDRGYSSFECVEELLKIKNLIAIRGNHDECFFQSMKTGGQNLLFNQGGKETLESYIRNCNPKAEISIKMSGYITNFTEYPEIHLEFFKNQLPYYIDKDNNCFVHGGFNRHYLIEETGKTHGNISDLWWDRDLLLAARSYESMLDKTYPFKIKNKFKEIFIGHTPVQYFEKTHEPRKYANIWDLDTGCGKGYMLTIMDLETKEYWQSTYGNKLI
jgi:serine/threonine protein phosphatase 1